MESPSSVRQRARRQIDLAGDLVADGDAFSLKVSSALDKRFWVRIEREPHEGMLVVTDFSPGERPFAELAAGMSIAVGALWHAGLRGLMFRDIVPGGEQTDGFPVKLLRAADLVKQLGTAVAETLATAVARFDMQPRLGKVDAVIVFADGPAIHPIG